ncbi:MAG: terminase small subunit [Wohlfahrtiimonas sp.]
MSKGKLKLNDRQEMFCLEFIKDLNATQAAIRAGYSKKTAEQQASRLLTVVKIKTRIDELKSKRNERLQVGADYVLKRLVEIDEMDVLDILNDGGGIKPVKDWPIIWRRSLSGIEVVEMITDGDPIGALKKIKWPDKIKNLELLGKHISVGAFDKAQQGPIEFVMTGKKRDDEDNYL